MRSSVTSSAREASRLCIQCRRLTTSSRTFTATPASCTVAARSSSLQSALVSPPISPRSRLQLAAPHINSSSFQKRAFASSDTSEQTTSTTNSSVDVNNPPKTHYDLFPSSIPSGPPPSGPFHVDTRALRREFLQLQARAHPDLHPASAKARAEATSARINEAYKTLANPLLRAQYLLSLRGVDVAADETLKVEEPGLLMMVLEAREEIEDATSEEDLEAPRRINEDRILAGEEALGKAFVDDDVEAAKREAVRMRYWVNIRESLDNWELGKPVVLEH